ncbi:MAG: TOMM precursor leader peptide-binding protein [Actinomycetota bacterium]|nr:TOMM precursor leader peptide-binding protein [Actinomycetota bacterium]
MRDRKMPDKLPRRPLLPGLYHVVEMGADKVQIANAGRSVVLSGPGLAERLTPFLQALNGTKTLDELHSQFAGLAPQVLHALQEKGMLTEASEVEDRPEASPTMTALGLPGPPSPPRVAEMLAKSSVFLLGCGPVGCTVAVLLGKAGLGRLVLADTDAVDTRAVALCPVLSPAHDRRPFAEVARSLCLELTATLVEVVGNPEEHLLEGADLAVIECGYESSGQQNRVADACLQSGIPYLLYTQDALEVIIGPLVAKGGRPCHHCAETRRMANIARPKEYAAYQQHRASAAPRPDAFLAAHCATVAGIVATEILKYLTGADPMIGAVTIMDLLRTETRKEEIFPIPGCIGCQLPESDG